MAEQPKEQTGLDTVKLVEDLLGVIKYLTEDGGAPPFNGRFVSIRDDKDVSAEVDPVIARAEAFLQSAAPLPPGAQGKSLYPVHLDADQLQIVKDLLEQASSREADPDSPIFQMLDEVRAARRRSPHFKLSPTGAVTAEKS